MSSTHHGILLHVVFGTMYRHPHLADSWRDELFAVIGGIAKEHQAVLLAAVALRITFIFYSRCIQNMRSQIHIQPRSGALLQPQEMCKPQPL